MTFLLMLSEKHWYEATVCVNKHEVLDYASVISDTYISAVSILNTGASCFCLLYTSPSPRD